MSLRDEWRGHWPVNGGEMELIERVRGGGGEKMIGVPQQAWCFDIPRLEMSWLRKKFVLLSTLLALGLPSFAATPKEVTYKSGEDTVHALLYTPPGQGPFPGLIVIHEWFGLNDWVKAQASKIADRGYVALAIDLYRGKVATNSEAAHELMRGSGTTALIATGTRLFISSSPHPR